MKPVMPSASPPEPPAPVPERPSSWYHYVAITTAAQVARDLGQDLHIAEMRTAHGCQPSGPMGTAPPSEPDKG